MPVLTGGNTNINKTDNDTPILTNEKKQNNLSNITNVNINKSKFFEPMSNKLNAEKSTSIPFGTKRNYTNYAEPQGRFVFKFNEGVTNSVRRTLNINYFFK